MLCFGTLHILLELRLQVFVDFRLVYPVYCVDPIGIENFKIVGFITILASPFFEIFLYAHALEEHKSVQSRRHDCHIKRFGI